MQEGLSSRYSRQRVAQHHRISMVEIFAVSRKEGSDDFECLTIIPSKLVPITASFLVLGK